MLLLFSLMKANKTEEFKNQFHNTPAFFFAKSN